MRDANEVNFGLLIAFLAPGFLCLWGLSPFVPVLATWISTASEHPPTVGGFLYITVASLSLGVILSAIRCVVIDNLHHHTGVKTGAFDFGSLREEHTFKAFIGVVNNHYRYYQFYANVLVAEAVVAAGAIAKGRGRVPTELWIVAAVLALILYGGSRDALSKYYARRAELVARK